jgi:hypothetical protein
VLALNALLMGLFIALCATFTTATPVWWMIVILLIGGFFRSLQFTGINSLSYADTPPKNEWRQQFCFYDAAPGN